MKNYFPCTFFVLCFQFSLLHFANALPPTHPIFSEIAALSSRKDGESIKRLLDLIAVPPPSDPIGRAEQSQAACPAFKVLLPNGKEASAILLSSGFLDREISLSQAESFALLIAASEMTTQFYQVLKTDGGRASTHRYNLLVIQFYLEHPNLRRGRSLYLQGIVPDAVLLKAQSQLQASPRIQSQATGIENEGMSDVNKSQPQLKQETLHKALSPSVSASASGLNSWLICLALFVSVLCLFWWVLRGRG